MKTHGTYGWRPQQQPSTPYRDAQGDPVRPRMLLRGEWVLDVEPTVRMRARRIFPRVTTSARAEVLVVADTMDVARDLVWLMERYPLDPVDAESERRLAASAEAQVDREAEIDRVIAGTGRRLSLPQEPSRSPREYQLTAARLVRTRKRLLLGDEVGLGKTFTCLLSLTFPDALPALVVPPTHLPGRWMDEIRSSFPWLTVELARTGIPSLAAQHGELADVTIVPYSRLDKWAATLAGGVRTVIFDEAQELRNGESTLKGRAAALVSDRAEYVIGATATPVYNYGGEMFHVANVISPAEFGTREEFVREWGAETGGKLRVRNASLLGRHLRDTGFLLARTRADVGRELPKTIKHAHTVDMDMDPLNDAHERIRALAEKILATDTTGSDRFQAGGEIDWMLRQATGVGKAPYVADFVKLLLESEEKVLLFGWHREVYDIWMQALAEYGPLLYTGTESPAQKRRAEETFKDPDSDCRVLIMSLRSGAGVDGLQKVARVAVFGELDWSPQVHEQAIGRLRRDGMGDDPPVAYFLNTVDGSDPALLDVLQIKRQQAEPIMTADGGLAQNSEHDPSRARRLAMQVLGLKEEASVDAPPPTPVIHLADRRPAGLTEQEHTDV